MEVRTCALQKKNWWKPTVIQIRMTLPTDLQELQRISSVVDCYETGLFNRILFEVEYNRRKKNDDDLGVRV